MNRARHPPSQGDLNAHAPLRGNHRAIPRPQNLEQKSTAAVNSLPEGTLLYAPRQVASRVGAQPRRFTATVASRYPWRRTIGTCRSIHTNGATMAPVMTDNGRHHV